MVPDSEPSLRSVCASGIQYALAATLLAIPQLTDHPWLFYTYYGVGVLAVPTVIRVASGHALAPAQRLYFGLGLSLHPYSMYLDLYPAFEWWDVLAHFVSATLLAGGLYVVLRGARGAAGGRPTAVTWVHAVALLGVLAGALAWEVYEIYVPWLTVYGEVDTAKDILVGLGGWAVVAGVQHRVLGPIPRGAAARLGGILGREPGSEPVGGERVERPMTDGGRRQE